MKKFIVALMVVGLAAVSFAQDLDAPTADVAGQSSDYNEIWAEFQAIVAEGLAGGHIYRHGDGAHEYGWIIALWQGEFTGLDQYFFGGEESFRDEKWAEGEYAGLAAAERQQAQFEEFTAGLTAAEKAQFIEDAQQAAEALLALATN